MSSASLNNKNSKHTVSSLINRLKSNDDSLTSCQLSWKKVDDSQLEELSEALEEHKSIASLDLSSNMITAVGRLSVCLAGHPSLTSLELYNNQLDVYAAEALAEALKFNTVLLHLDVQQNCIGSDGVKFFAEALLQNHTLQSLDLGHNSIGNLGGRCLLEGMEQNYSLVNISLEGNSVNKQTCNDILSLADRNYYLQAEEFVEDDYLQHSSSNNSNNNNNKRGDGYEEEDGNNGNDNDNDNKEEKQENEQPTPTQETAKGDSSAPGVTSSETPSPLPSPPVETIVKLQPRMTLSRNTSPSFRRLPRKKLSLLNQDITISNTSQRKLPSTATTVHPSRLQSSHPQFSVHPPKRHESRGEQPLRSMSRRKDSSIPHRGLSTKLSFRPGKNRHVVLPILRSLSPTKMVPSTTLDFLQLFERQHPEEPTAAVLIQQVKQMQRAFDFLQAVPNLGQTNKLARKLIQLRDCTMPSLSELQTALADETGPPSDVPMGALRTVFYHTAGAKSTAMVEACQILYENMDPYLLQAAGEFIAHQQQEMLKNPLDAVGTVLGILSTDYRSHTAQVQGLHRVVQFTKRTSLDSMKESLERIVWMVTMADATTDLLGDLPQQFESRKQRFYARLDGMSNFTPVQEEACYLADRALSEIFEPRQGGEVEQVLFRSDAPSDVSIEEALVADLMGLTLEEAKAIREKYERVSEEHETVSQRRLHSSLRSLSGAVFPSKRRPSKSVETVLPGETLQDSIESGVTEATKVDSSRSDNDAGGSIKEDRIVVVKDIAFSPGGAGGSSHQVPNTSAATRMRMLYPKTHDIVFDPSSINSSDSLDVTNPPSVVVDEEYEVKIKKQEETIQELKGEIRMLKSGGFSNRNVVNSLQSELLRIKEEASRKEAWWIEQIDILAEKLGKLTDICQE